MTDITPPYSLGDLTAQPGIQVRGYCQVSLGTITVSLPVAITHGAEPGPVLGITAGIHGGEYVPMVAVRQFIRELDPARMRGTVVACLQSSPVAFQQRAAFVNPLDGQNLEPDLPRRRDRRPDRAAGRLAVRQPDHPLGLLHRLPLR